MGWNKLFEPQVLIFMVPIVGIIVGGVVAVTKLIIRHRERIAMIEHGMDPDRGFEGDDEHPGGE